jgi:DNA-3-methyladenine glycosylase
MVNVTSEEPGVGAGVLLRALEPLQGIEMMQRFRKTTRMRDIARGPGRLAQAMQVDKRYDGVDLCAAGPLWLGTAARRVGPICSSTRIGLTREIHRERRFFESGSPHVSGPRSRSDTKWGSHGVPSSSPPIADPEQHHDDGYANRIND